jgi:hypothetical protein
MTRFVIAQVLERTDGTPIKDEWVLIDHNTPTASLRLTTDELLDLDSECIAAVQRIYDER